MAVLKLEGHRVQEDRRLSWPEPSRAQLNLEGTINQLSLDERPISPEGTLHRLPALAGELYWRDDAGRARRIQLDPSDEARPGSAEKECLTGFSHRLAERLKGPIPFNDLGKVPLFFHEGLWRQLEPEQVDAHIGRALGALFGIAHTPRSRLREEHVVMPIDRVRRPAADADRHLVRNGRFLVGGLIPRATHLKARLLEDDLSLYENRAVVTLCQSLKTRALRRLLGIQQALDTLGDVEHELHRLAKIGLHKRAGLWRKDAGLGKHTDNLREKGERYRRALRLQLEACSAVLDGPIGRELRHCEAVRGALLDSNIFAYDERYGAIATLWRHWQRSLSQRDPLDPVLDDLDRGYTQFVRLVVGRALRELRFKSDGALALGDQAPPLQLSREDGWEVTLSPARWGVELAYRYVDPEHEETRRRSGRRPDPLKRLTFRGHFDTSLRGEVKPDEVWLHPVTRLQATSSRDHYLMRASVGHTPRAPDGDVPPPSLPVAPWHFQSVHGVMRLLRARMLGAAISEGRIPNRCPLCGGASRVGAHSEDDRTCNDCKARWGRRQCNHCHTWTPKLLPDLPRSMDLEETSGFSARQALLDTLVGADGLADLCQAEERMGKMWMICPQCGRCGADKPAQQRCARCSTPETINL